MMGRAHALSGATVWLAACAASTAVGHRPGPLTVLVGAGVCAAFSLVPDIDHPKSLIAGSLGPVSRAVAAGVDQVATAIYTATAGPLDPPARDGHRKVTHTAVFAILVGVLVAAAVGWAVPPLAWLGLPAGLGCLVHCLGDALTHAGVPLLWPVPIRGRRWYRVGTPKVMRFATGDSVEAWRVVPLLIIGGALAGWVTLAA